jgi:hypothetical protein
MFGNDVYGDCVWAGAAHETMLLRADAGATFAPFTSQTVEADYSAVTGFVQGRDDTDNGTDVSEAAAYRRKTGIIDALGTRHTIDVYAALRVGDTSQLALATFLFGAVGIGVILPDNAEDQFTQAEIWDTDKRPPQNNGGHYIPCVGRNSVGNFLFVSWGRLQAATPRWVQCCMDEGLVYISRERLRVSGLSPQGFDAAALDADFKEVTS